MPFVTKLSKEDQDFAKKDIGEYDSARQSAIDILKDKISLDPGLKVDTDDAFLVRFLRARKYDIERAYFLVRKYYAARNEEILQDFKPSTITACLDKGVVTIMDGYNPIDRTKIIVFRPGIWSSGQSIPFVELPRAMLMAMDIVLQDEVVQVHGVRVVIDASNVGMDQAKELAAGWASIIFRIIQDAMPLRLKGMHYINESTIMDFIFTILKQFMKEKMVKRLGFHGSDLSELHKHVAPDALPENLGGQQPAIPNQKFINTMKASEDYFTAMSKFYFDDPKSLFKNRRQDASDSGMGGTYKKISTD